jgi:dTDP-4-amino-4,6-dideoxygalactose transaminase
MNQAHMDSGDRLENTKSLGIHVSGIDTAIAEVAGLPPRVGYQPDLDAPVFKGPVAFLELKRADFQRVEEFLELSRRANHWTNFGPVTAALERALEYVMAVPRSRAVVMCSSGTTALFALAGTHALKQGRPLRIVGSAYGFFSSNIGPLASTVTLIDCDERGLLDIDLLSRISLDSYDAVMVTNVFGMSSELHAHRNFCRANNKVLLVDNATAPIAYERNYDEAPDEIVSFHHTKPWGMGEGGCAVVAREDANMIRGFLNFGVGLPSSVAAYATNGKISDFSSALILDRLERYKVWTGYYRAQYARISSIAKGVGLRELRPINGEQVYAHLPLLAPMPRRVEDLRDGPFPVRKYYRPLADHGVPVASSLYEHMVNIPTHSGMAAVPGNVIEEVLRRIRNGIALGK